MLLLTCRSALEVDRDAACANARLSTAAARSYVSDAQGEPLADVAAVVFDEVHERSLDMDLALALCADLQQLGRPELRCCCR